MVDDSPKLKVLLVEDSEDDAELLLLELRRQGIACDSARVDTRPDLEAALAVANWDLIISDYQMPQFDGMAAFDVYRRTGLDVPFIFVSGVLGEERAVQAMRAGARDYLIKGQLGRLGISVQREVQAARDRRSKRAVEEAADHQQRRLAMAIEATGSGVFEHDIPLTAPYLNSTCAELIGEDELDPTRIDLAWIEERVHPEDWEGLSLAYRRLWAGQDQRLSFELRARHASGEWLDLIVDAKAFARDDGGRARRVVGVVRSLTERHQLQRQLQEAQKMEAVGQLAGGLAHDLNNILTVIYAFGGLVMEALPPEVDCRGDVEQILAAAHKASQLTSQLLAFSRRKHHAPRTVAIDKLIERLWGMLSRVLDESIAYHAEMAPGLWPAYIDPDALEQVILNMVINARDAMPEGGQLQIAARNRVLDELGDGGLSGEFVSIALADTGVGMNEATLQQIFAPFFTTKGPDKGTGLGLAMSIGIIKQAKGDIRVTSAPGMGTTFELLIPRSRAVPTPSSLPPPPRARAEGHERILLVEDHEALRASVERGLRSLGYVVVTAPDGEAALARCEGDPEGFSLVIMDVVMPGMGGRALAQILGERFPDLRVLFISGYTGEPVGDSLAPLAHPLLDKPFTLEQLARAVERVLKP